MNTWVTYDRGRVFTSLLRLLLVVFPFALERSQTALDGSIVAAAECRHHVGASDLFQFRVNVVGISEAGPYHGQTS